MAYTNIKTEIDGKIYTNILREITGDILNEVLKKMVDSLGKGYRYMGILEPDDSRPSGDENMFMIATEAGYYTALANDVPAGITICSFSESSIQVETILNLDDIFSGNHSWGGSNTFNGVTQFQNEVDVSFENVYDLEDGETLSGKLASLVTAIATKISKVTGAVEDNLATFDENGSVKDSGVSLADIDEKIDECAKPTGIYEKMVAGSARGVLSPSAIEELFLFQRTANGAGGTGAAIFQSIKGNSIVWNQLLTPKQFSALDGDTGWGNITCTENNDGSYTVVVSETLTVRAWIVVYLQLNGHTCYWNTGASANAKSESNITATFNNQPGHSGITTAAASSTSFYIFFKVGTAAGTYTFKPGVTDLSLLFNGSVPGGYTAADFERDFPLGYYATNPGAILNNCATGMVTDGFNLWDEETAKGYWAVGGWYDNDTVTSAKNLIPVFPSTSYYIKKATQATLYFYDINKAFISSTANVANQAVTTPANCYYIGLNGVTVGNDCVNLSWSGYRNGEYEPHWSDTTALPITTATGKLNGEGESVVLSPTGIPSLGAIANKYIAEKGVLTKYDKQLGVYVFTGTESWNAYGSAGAKAITVEGLGGKTYDASVSPNILSDVPLVVNNRNTIYTGGAGIAISGNTIYVSDSTKVSAGMQLIYELATEQLYILDTPVPVVARVDEDGTQTILPQGVDESGVPMTAPFKASIQYPVKMGIGPIGQQSFINYLETMKSAGKIASYTMVWDATTGVFDFTIS